jgi:hypothetical protein
LIDQIELSRLCQSGGFYFCSGRDFDGLILKFFEVWLPVGTILISELFIGSPVGSRNDHLISSSFVGYIEGELLTSREVIRRDKLDSALFYRVFGNNPKLYLRSNTLHEWSRIYTTFISSHIHILHIETSLRSFS